MNTTASLSFEPTTISATAGDLIPVDVLIYSGDDAIISTDIYITYDPQYLEIAKNIDGGDLFQQVGVKQIAAGRAYVYGINLNTKEAKPANGNVARIYFRSIAPGNSTLHIDCVPFSEKTSQIISQKNELINIINCDSTRTHTSEITVKGGVLGAQTQNIISANKWYMGMAILVILLTALLYVRYRRLTKELKS